MSPVILNPSFETDSDWTMVGTGAYTDIEYKDGLRCLAVTTGRVFDPFHGTWFSATGSAYQTVTDLEYGKVYQLALFAKSELGDQDLPWTATIRWPDGTTHTVIDGYPFSATTWTEYSGSFLALDTSCVLTIGCPNTSGDFKTLFFDSVSGSLQGGSMAVLLAERAVGQVLVALQHANGLRFEIQAIAGERSDGIAMTEPDRWYTSPRSELSHDAVSVEVFSDVTRFVDQEKRLPSWTMGVREPMPSEVDVTIRLTHANRDLAPLGVMRKRTERYMAAIARVLRNYPTLMDSSGSVRWAQLNEARTTTEDAIVDNESRIVVDRLSIGITVNLNEASSGEGESGGGQPPSFIVSEN